LAQKGVDVTVVSTDVSGALPTREQADGVQILRTRAWPTDRDYYLAPGIYSAVRTGSWDLVHCQGYHTLVTPVAILSALRVGIPFVVTFHSGGHSSRLRNALRGLQRSVLRPLITRAAALIAVSRFEADFFSQHLGIPRGRFVVIPNGSNLPEFTPPLASNRDETLILSVGRLERYKGHHRVIAALPRVREQIPNVRLRIVGSGPYEATLRRHAREHGVADCVEVGSIAATDRTGMAELLGQAALVTLISEYEAHPISVVEALAMHRPVLVADTSGLSEFAEAGHARAIPLDATVEQTASAIVRQISDPITAPCVALPSWDGCAESVLRVYQAVAAGEAVCGS
jgi:glycosyltransferase involved in cell wall biosynthesis